MSRRRRIEVKPNVIDRIVSYMDPVAGHRRLVARYQGAAVSAYIGASKTRKQTKNWQTSGGDADSDILPELEALRLRTRDLARNAPIATGAINTKVTNIVGGGLTPHPRIDAELLGMTEDEADEWEQNAKREFRLWAGSQDCSADRSGNFYELEALAFRSVLENGDVFALTPKITRRGRPYRLAINLIEADRVCNKDFAADSTELAGGIRRDAQGAPTHVQILKQHPGSSQISRFRRGRNKHEWLEIPIFGPESGRRNVLHLFNRLRVGQSRGVPDLAPVIETLKQLDRYTEAEITAAVISGMFTVFVKAEGGLNPLSSAGESDRDDDSNEVQMGSGAIVDLGENESIETANPGRPNTAFDPFVMSILRQVGVALEIPFELLIGHFTASYSASRAALEQAWKFFKSRRSWLAYKFCNPVYEAWLTEAVTIGRIDAPGFLNGDPAVRLAYLGVDWVGPAKGHIQPLQEINAEKVHLELGTKTLDEVTAEATGGNFEANHRQRAKEVRMRREAGLETGAISAPASEDDNPIDNNRPAEDSDEIDETERDDEGADRLDDEEADNEDT